MALEASRRTLACPYMAEPPPGRHRSGATDAIRRRNPVGNPNFCPIAAPDAVVFRFLKAN
ncbi:hypothetical protein CBM2609_B120022 [Cupriavidus taiwanensis]|nr:hypothetical protein CBM2604_B130022 [Cupriavidus taiwanensis]SOZ31063.1 hypothetical protein CBM2609_B120022 [Cupriavidus taiwanensis]SOZ47140.1 hypothetical protein CBM2610_B100022 [Cupriavidus taiwanensis]